MAEIIGLVASVAGLLHVSLRASKSLHSLQSNLRNAPSLIQDLADDVDSTSAVLTRVEEMIRDSEESGIGTPTSSLILVDLDAQLRRAKLILDDLDILTQKLASEAPTRKRVQWCLKKSRALDLQRGLKEVRTRINDLLVAYTSSSSTRMNLELRGVSSDVQNLGTRMQAASNHVVLVHRGLEQFYADYSTRMHALQSTMSNLGPEMGQYLLEAIAASRGTPMIGPLPEPSRTGRPLPCPSHYCCTCQNLSHSRYPLRYLQPSNSRLMRPLSSYRRIQLYVSEDNALYHAQRSQINTVRHFFRLHKAALYDVHDDTGWSILTMAFYGYQPWEKKLEVMSTLLQLGADPDQEDDDGVSVRHLAGKAILSSRTSQKLRTQLAELFPQASSKDDLGLTFLHKIVLGSCRVDLEETLQSKSPEIMDGIGKRDRFGHTPLFYAAQSGDPRMVKALVQAGAAEDKVSASLALVAAASSSFRCVEITDLLLKSADPNKIDEREDEGALHAAARVDNTDLARKLLSVGADVNLSTPEYKDTPIMCAARYNSTETLRLLINHEGDVDAVSADGASPLVRAVEYNAHEAQRILLERGASRLCINDDGTLLHAAARTGDVKTFETLAEFQLKELDVDARNGDGLTAPQVFERRFSVTDEHRLAFRKLLEVVGSQPDEGGSSDDEMLDGMYVDEED